MPKNFLIQRDERRAAKGFILDYLHGYEVDGKFDMTVNIITIPVLKVLYLKSDVSGGIATEVELDAATSLYSKVIQAMIEKQEVYLLPDEEDDPEPGKEIVISSTRWKELCKFEEGRRWKLLKELEEETKECMGLSEQLPKAPVISDPSGPRCLLF